jgi:hypothetical protein
MEKKGLRGKKKKRKKEKENYRALPLLERTIPLNFTVYPARSLLLLHRGRGNRGMGLEIKCYPTTGTSCSEPLLEEL